MGEHLFQEEKAMQGLEKFLAKLSHRDKALMKDLKNKAHTNVEHELHTAAARKMPGRRLRGTLALTCRSLRSRTAETSAWTSMACRKMPATASSLRRSTPGCATRCK